MPCLVREMRIGRYGKDFYATLLEFLIAIRQVCQFCWADKGEICRVKEEHRPFVFDIGLADLNELTLSVSIGFERFDLGVD